MRTWIEHVGLEAAAGRLAELYGRLKRRNGTLSNIWAAQSLRPHLIEGHVAFYRAALGHSANKLPLWFLEAVGVQVSALNACDYCVDHHRHFGGLAWKGDKAQWAAMTEALIENRPETAFSDKELALLDYARRLTLAPSTIEEEDIEALREAGADDGEILEVNQVAAYFAYANRTVLGLGVTLEGEKYDE